MDRKKILWNATWLFLRPLLAVFCRFRIAGWKNIKNVKKPCIFAIATHSHILDSYIVGAALPFNCQFYPINYMTKDSFFRMPVIKHIVKAYSAFPVIRGLGLEKTLEPAVQLIKQKGAIGMFIEGNISPKGELRNPKPGAAALALITGAPIIPVTIRGTHQIRNPLKWLFLQKKIFVCFGQKINPENKANPSREDIENLTQKIFEEIKKLYYSC
jgi:1-acyl-sn-glycerol-3-phosphate acyltransferase